MKKIKLLLITLIPIFIIINTLLATETSPRYLNMQIVINPITSISLLSASDISLNAATPSFDYTDKPGLVPLNNDPWFIIEPSKIRLHIENNTQANIYIFTDHQRQYDYWNITSLQIDANRKITSTTDINGLINTASLNENSYLSTIQMQAWADWYNEGRVTKNAEAKWVYVLDTMGQPLFTKGNQPLALLDSWQTVLKRDLDVYLAYCFNSPKFSGQYYARIIISLDSQ